MKICFIDKFLCSKPTVIFIQILAIDPKHKDRLGREWVETNPGEKHLECLWMKNSVWLSNVCL